MKRRNAAILALATLALAGAASCSQPKSTPELAQLYATVDKEIGERGVYKQEKEKRIARLKQELGATEGHNERLRVCDNLIEEYKAFVCDSALKYVEEGRQIAAAAGNSREQTRLKIKEADIASHAGLFTQAHEMLISARKEPMDSALLADYYSTYCALFQYETEYLPEGEYTQRSSKLRRVYTDSLLKVASPGSFACITNWADMMKEGHHKEVKEKLLEQIERYEPGTRHYSILTSTLARVYGDEEDKENERRYLALSAISDIKGAIKENIAIRELATRVFEDGDTERANKYMKASLEDADFFASNLTNAQSRRMLPVIDQAYDHQQKKLQHRQLLLIYFTTFLLLIATAAWFVIFRQMGKVKETTRNLSERNEEISKMSEKLQEMNEALEKSNTELTRTTRTAEEYAGLFMEFGSVTISNLQKYHLTLRNLALQGNVKGLLKKLDKSDATSEALKTFYQKFDEAILSLYPDFDSKVNSLLTEEGAIQLRPGERMNTELRILALIRIGITDSEKISEFLRCSITTIYTYRSKLKRRAIDPEGFEKAVSEL